MMLHERLKEKLFYFGEIYFKKTTLVCDSKENIITIQGESDGEIPRLVLCVNFDKMETGFKIQKIFGSRLKNGDYLYHLYLKKKPL